jgi:hypothetical protein
MKIAQTAQWQNAVAIGYPLLHAHQHAFRVRRSVDSSPKSQADR